jgi:expansin (peptidoglycan-binding protein)
MPAVLRRFAVTTGALLIAFGVARPAAAACAGDHSGTGFATSYQYPYGFGACNFDGDDNGVLYAAISPADDPASQLCGSYLEVTGPLGTTQVRIVDRCATCAKGDLRLHSYAFAEIAAPSDTRVHITWKTIPDPTGDMMLYHLSAGSNVNSLQIQPRHGLYAFAKLEYLAPGGYITARHETNNYYTVDASVGAPVPLSGSFTIRVTDLNGDTVVDSGIPLVGNHIHPSFYQFPVCATASVAAPPRALALRAPAPNPFSRVGVIAFDLAREGDVLLRLYDAGGRRVRTLVDAHLSAGSHEARWDGLDDAGRRLAPGTYFCRLSSGAAVDQKRITLID